MKQFNYGLNESISGLELAFALPGFIVGVAILSLPHNLAEHTTAVDGWVSIVVSGIFIMIATLLAMKLALTFPGQTFLSYSSALITRPLAMMLNFGYSIITILITAFVIRAVADIAKHYLFERTPIEVIAISFLFVVVYAVSGSRPGLFRINIMFFPIILAVLFLVIILNVRWVELDNFLPLFKSDFSGYISGLNASISAYTGFGLVLFYTSLVRKPKNMYRKVIFGIGLPIFLYIVIFFTTIGVFGNIVTSNLVYPTVELAKRVEFPGGFIERIESLFYIVWMMAIFTTAAFSYDIAVYTIQSAWKKISKIKIIIILSPIIFLISMFPQTNQQVEAFSNTLTKFSLPYTIAVTIILLIIAKVRGVKKSG